MQKLIISVSLTLALTLLLRGQVSFRCETAPQWKAGEFNIVKISINLNSSSGFARFRQDYPEGIEEIVPEDLPSGDLSWYNSQLNIVWLNIPENGQLTFSYMVKPSTSMNGIIEPGGTLIWIRDGKVKETYEMNPISILILPPGMMNEKPIEDIGNLSTFPSKETGVSSQEKSIVKSDSIVYRIQLSASSKPIPPEQIAGNNQLLRSLVVIRIKEGNIYKYQAGSFSNYDDAVTVHRKLVASGFKDAFVVAFRGNTRIPITKAMKENQ